MGSRTRAGLTRAVLSIATVGACATALVTGTGSAVAAGGKYVALGDSYSSGVGTRQYLNDGTNCQRSVYAYPELTAGKIGATLNFQACSGANTHDVLTNQAGALDTATKYVTITVGGNDAGFASVLTRCSIPLYDCTPDINNAENYMRNSLPGALASVYAAIAQRSPNAQVAVVGYPRLFNGVECNAFGGISPTEQAKLNSAADLLDDTINTAAAMRGFAYVDPRGDFTGHAVCDAVEWINGLSNPVSESYHPNRLGQVGYENLVVAALQSAHLPTSATTRR